MIPTQNDPRWSRALQSQSELADAGLATRILISRLRHEVAANPATMTSRIAELRMFFEENDFARPDIARL